MKYEPLGYKLNISGVLLDLEWADATGETEDGITWSLRQRGPGMPSFRASVTGRSVATVGELSLEALKCAMVMAVKDEFAAIFQRHFVPGSTRTDMAIEANHPVSVTLEHLRKGVQMAAA